MKQFILFFIFTSCLFSFVDEDFDGVDDKIDRCLGTSFEDLVDEDGCPYDKNRFGLINFEITSSNHKDDNLDTNIYSINIDYQYKNYLLSFFKSYYKIDYQNNIDDSISVGYLFDFEDYMLKSYVGEENQNLFFSLSLDYYLNNFIYSSYLSYVFEEIGDNYVNYSLGITFIAQKYDISITYLNSGSENDFVNKYQNLDTSLIYTINKNLYTKVGYNQNLLNSKSYDIYITLGINFE